MSFNNGYEKKIFLDEWEKKRKLKFSNIYYKLLGLPNGYVIKGIFIVL